MLFKPNRLIIQALLISTCASLPQTVQAQSQIGGIKLNPPPTGRLVELIKRTRDNQKYDLYAMQALFNGPQPTYDSRVNMSLPAGQGVPICIDFIARYLNATANNKPIAQDYAFAAIYSAQALKRYGSQAGAALPVLLKAVNNSRKSETLSDVALDAFVTIAPNDERAMPILIKRLDDSGIKKLQFTTRELARRGSKARAAIPKLLRIMQPLAGSDQFGEEERLAFQIGEDKCLTFEALGAISREHFAFSVDTATDKLSTLDALPLEESAAVFATLIKAGKAAAPAVPSLVKLLRTEPPIHLRYASLLAIQTSGQAADPTVLEVLLQLNRTREGNSLVFQLSSKIAQAGVTPETPQTLPVLLKLLESDRLQDRIDALVGLERMKRTANPAVPAIVASLKKEMLAAKKESIYGIVDWYEATLWQLGQSTPEVSDSIYELMLPNSPYLSKTYGPTDFRSNWLTLLTAVGMPTDPKKRAFIESQILIALKSAPDEDSPGTYGTAAHAARTMKASPEKLVAPLTKILSSIDEKVWLAPFKQTSKPVQETWFLGSGNGGNKQNAAVIFGYREVIQTLGSFGPKAKSALPALRKLANMPANAALWEVKPDAIAAVKKIEG